ncbi:MAG: U32 family peptidase [Candidatus Thorarchaeota archaeon]
MNSDFEENEKYDYYREVYLDIPTYFNKETINFIKEIDQSKWFNIIRIPVKHVYGSLSGILSARETKRLCKVEPYMLESHIKELKKINVDFFYAFNTSCLGSLSMNKMMEIKNTIKTLSDIGVKNFIVAHPFLIEVLREQIPDCKIKASVILEIDNSVQLKYFLEKVDIVNLSTRVNRDFTFLKMFKKYRKKIELLCNEVCLYMCPFRASHYTIESHRHKNREYCSDYPVNLCYEKMTEVEIIRSRFILPEWINYYSRFASFFKISGRTFSQSFIHNVANHYSSGNSPKNILDLFPIVTGSIRNEQNKITDNRVLEIPEHEKTLFLTYFKLYGNKCQYLCPCGRCNSYTKYFERGKHKND